MHQGSGEQWRGDPGANAAERHVGDTTSESVTTVAEVNGATEAPPPAGDGRPGADDDVTAGAVVTDDPAAPDGEQVDPAIAADESAADEMNPNGDPRIRTTPPRRDERGVDDISAISRLKFRYLRTLDTKEWEEFADTMIPEATATYSEYLQFESRDAFLAFMRNTLGPHVITEHRCDHPEIDVDGDTATGTWYLADTVLIPEHNMLLRGAAFYTDRYVRCEDGQWRIAHTGYERSYEVVLSLSDLPSLRLTSSRWGLIARESGIAPVERDPGAAPVRREPESR